MAPDLGSAKGVMPDVYSFIPDNSQGPRLDRAIKAEVNKAFAANHADFVGTALQDYLQEISAIAGRPDVGNAAWTSAVIECRRRLFARLQACPRFNAA
jgi:hypothetical protein